MFNNFFFENCAVYEIMWKNMVQPERQQMTIWRRYIAHPPQHKYSAIRFLYNMLNSYNLNIDEYQQEENIIHNILRNNSFPILSHTRLTPKQRPPLPPPEKGHRWVTFTYSGRETRYITNLFKHSNLQIAFRTNNTLHSHLSNNTHHEDKFTRSGVYKLTCPDSGKAYVGQTG
jgi:hypothetical protein